MQVPDFIDGLMRVKSEMGVVDILELRNKMTALEELVTEVLHQIKPKSEFESMNQEGAAGESERDRLRGTYRDDNDIIKVNHIFMRILFSHINRSIFFSFLCGYKTIKMSR